MNTDPTETDEERADRLETERAHAKGDHEYCGITCEAEFTTEMLRNGILWRAVPGSGAMLDELLRRARAEAAAPPSAPADRAAVLAEAQQAGQGEQLVHVGWWCWRGTGHGHLATQACRSDNVPLHVPAEWADDMRAVLQRIEDDNE